MIQITENVIPMVAPEFLDAYISPIRDSVAAQVGITAVFILILLDIVFGLANALWQKKYSSEIMRRGIGHKCAEFGFLLVGLIVDATIVGGFDLGFQAPVLITICVYICLMEIGSLMETFADMNPQLANSPLFKLLDSVVHRDKEDEEEEGQDD